LVGGTPDPGCAGCCCDWNQISVADSAGNLAAWLGRKA